MCHTGCDATSVIQNTDYSVTVWGNSSKNLFEAVDSASSTKFLITSGGNVGIGTTTPGSLLSLNNIANFTTATSTFYATGGVNLTAGCFSIAGNCLTTGVSSISNSDGTLTISPTTGAVVASLALGHANSWTGLQQFSNASTSLLSAYGPTYFGGTATSSFGTDGSLTLAGAFTANGNTTLANATSTNLAVNGTASTSNLVASTGFTFKNVTGFLKATAGAVATSLINLASDVTGILPVGNGGTGWSNVAAGAIPYGNGSSALATTSAGTAGQVLAFLNGVPTWTATTTLSTISGTLAVGSGGTGQTSFGQGWLNSDGTTISASTSPTLAYLTATSTTATSTFVGGATFATGGGNVGVGTTSPTNSLNVTFSNSSSDNSGIDITNSSSGWGSSIRFKNSAGGNNTPTIAQMLTEPLGTGGIFQIQTSNLSKNLVTAFTISNTQTVGIGTSSPATTLSVSGSGYLTGGLGVGLLNTTAGTLQTSGLITGGTTLALSGTSGTTTLASGQGFTIGSSQFMLQQGSGNVGIGTTSPSTILQVAGVITPNADNTYNLGNSTYRWAAVFAANGTIQTSDQRLKSNITDLSYGLPDILKLRPVSFTWTVQPGQGTKLGFIAQEVQPIMPETVSVGDDANHTLSLSYTEFIPAIVKSIQDIAHIGGAFKDNLIAWLGDVSNGIADLFANNVHARNELCVGDTCVTPDQFKAMVAAAGQSSSGNSRTSPSSSNSITTPNTPPVIHINGDNPARIHVGDTYADLGATIAGPQSDLNLGIHFFVKGSPIDAIQLDTTAAAIDTIDYVVTDALGLTSTTTRTVIIEPTQSPSILPDTNSATTSPAHLTELVAD